MPNLLLLFLLSCFYCYMKNINDMLDEATADFNLGHCSGNGVKVQPKSYFATYFIKGIGPILELGENTLIDQNLKFKYKFMETLCKESDTLKTIFEPMFEDRKSVV